MNHVVIVAVNVHIILNICVMATLVILITCIRNKTMKYEMKNFVKFATTKKVSDIGQKPKRDEHKRLRKIARKQKQLTRKLAN